MRKFNLLFSVFLLSLFELCVFSCDNETDIANNPKEDAISVSDFSFLGKWHNEFLVNAHNKYPNSEFRSISSKEDALKTLLVINKDFAKVNRLPIQYSNVDFDKYFDEFYKYADTEYISGVLLSKDNLRSTSSLDEVFTLKETLEFLKEKNELSNFSYQVLNDLIILVERNYHKELSDFELKKSVLSLIDRVNFHKYKKDSPEGALVASVLSISIHSLTFWEENSEIMYSNGKIAPWVGADIAGALIGGATGALSSYASSGRVSLTACSISAGVGAISGSTGLVGKAGRFISRLF